MFGIVQCYCPKNHAIYTSTFDGERVTLGQAIEILNNSLEEAIRNDVLLPVCARCAAPKRKWKFHAVLTGYADQAQLLCAIDELKKRKAEQALYVM